MDNIQEDIAYYKENRKSFAAEYAGKHLVIKGRQVVGVYNTNTEAMSEAAVLHEAGTYIIERPLELKANRDNLLVK